MTFRYYLSNILYGCVFLGMTVFRWHQAIAEGDLWIWDYLVMLSVISCFLFPYAKKAVENIVLKYTTSESWVTGAWTDTCLKSGVMGLYHGILFIFSIPIGLLSIIYIQLSKKAT
ncbi:hypothetical protein R6Y21_003021 [Escherichia coli]|uniref:colicin E1 family microcin immunity protein n=1 Tax=Escherichia coli TaxID=562 RepID=UPI000B48BE4E|nr:colicin E1 family microcin immunity protein [Escherichia coli]EIY7819335.1 hypothetical protein [Escherichia coli]EJG6379293.1 hypothetical protein [Escherichia coli]EJU4354954.1 hypothetical protein [Escherichia coli]EJV7203626.1 hypothetical protein [Escherichia coli]EKB3773803.1 hypothetical protein [Escherichia coli]